MNRKLLSLLRLLPQRENDLFKSTRNRLTLWYSGLLMLFLVLFITVVYSILYAVILQNQEQELDELASQEARMIESYLRQVNRSDLGYFQSQELVLAGIDQFFYYVTNSSGEFIAGDELIPELRADLVNMLQGWMPERNEFRQELVRANVLEWQPKARGANTDIRPTAEERDIHLLMTGHSIMYKGQFIGMLYVGKDISFAYQLFRWLLLILVGLAVLFFGFALVIGRMMSKKAMVPITEAFSRQREFVADASHELRTPLSVMLSSIDAMEMTMEEEEEFSHKLLRNMKNEVKRMTKLVGDLLTLARSDSGTVERLNETFDFRPPAEKAVQSVESLAASKNIRLRFDAPKTLMVNGDSERLTQLLYILLDNAIKYTPNGGDVALSLSAEGNELCMRVKDTGIGIDPDDQERIFARFYRSDKSRSRQMGGHGLGLAIAKWIVDTHGGTIRAASEIGKGSTFTVKIPVIPKSKKA